MKKLLLFILVLAGVISGISTQADSRIPKGQNIARGKKYKTNVIPTRKWQKYLKQVPNYDKVLTDGIVEKSNSGSFWVSTRCANFAGAANIDVIIDLGKEMPVSGIFTRHGARPSAGVCFPRKEEYYVSDDGVKFYKVGEFKNTFDDYTIKNQLERKKKFAFGVKQYGISGLKTKGRYVMVRTFGSGVDSFPTYVGYDEIFVIKGNFPLSQVKRSKASSISLKKVDLPAGVLGYRVNPLDWKKIVKEQPLFMALSPTQLLGDNDYHLSVGGTYVMPFTPILNTRKSISDIKLTCELPSSVKLISYNNSSKLTSRKPINKHAKPYIKYSFSITNTAKFLKGYMYAPYLVVQSKFKSPGQAGQGYYSYSYKAGGKKYTHKSSFNIKVDPRITGVTPKRFLTGYWLPYQARLLEDKKNAEEQIISFYRSLGYNCQNGGNRSVDGLKSCRKNGITVYGGGEFNNGLMISRLAIPDGERFIYHPKRKRDRIGVCPTLLYTSPKYSKILKQKFNLALTQADHVYSNWEPYMFMKQGCICDRCKQEFQKTSGLKSTEVNKIWPDCVMDQENDKHNAFSSYQYANIIKLAQKLTREAGVDLKLKHQPNFIISYEPSFVNPDKMWFKTHNHSLFNKDIDMTIMWSYPNSVKVDAFDIKNVPGNTLKKLPVDFANAKRIIAKSGHQKGNEKFPKILFMGTEHNQGSLVMPKDYYFMSLLCFFAGLDGYGTWCNHFKCDARYVVLNAKANTLISKLETIVLDGKKLDNARIKIVSPVPKKISGKTVKLTIVKAFKHKGQELVAIGNDHIARIYVKLQISGLSGRNIRLYDTATGKVYQKSRNSGYSAKELANGVIIPVDGKSWAALQIGRKPTGKYKIITAASLKKQLTKDVPKLKTVTANLN
jgi:hypothetical protein